jgi:Zn-dependent protease/CBS domain-containing protein
MDGFRLGSIAGIEIRIDYSWFVIFFLILWTLTRGVFPATYPGQDSFVYLCMGAAGALLVFASLIAHELSHSIVSRSRGLPVEGITLFIFGGMARASGEFKTPYDEFVVAGVGPLSSFVIAAVFWLISWAGAQWGLPAAVLAVASYLALINVVLAVFNLVPGFPLDGGRILRSFVWWRTGDLRRATKVATNGGRIFGFFIVVMGLLNLFGGNVVGGLWLVLIGWFIRFAAGTSYSQHVLNEALQDVRAQDVMTPHPHVVRPEVTLQAFIDEHVLDGLHHSYPVLRGSTPIGLVTLQLVRQVPRKDWPVRTVDETMLPIGPELVVAPEARMTEALNKLSRSPAQRVLVVHEGIVLGMITHTDVSRWLDRQRLREEFAPNVEAAAQWSRAHREGDEQIVGPAANEASRIAPVERPVPGSNAWSH